MVALSRASDRATRRRSSAPLPHEVVNMNSLHGNLHLMMVSFYRPTPERPSHSDRSRRLSLRPLRRRVAARAITVRSATGAGQAAPRRGETCLRMEDLMRLLERQADRLALVLLPGVQYRTGEAFDLARITQTLHGAGRLRRLRPRARRRQRAACAARLGSRFRRLVQLQVSERRARARSPAASCTSATRTPSTAPASPAGGDTTRQRAFSWDPTSFRSRALRAGRSAIRRSCRWRHCSPRWRSSAKQGCRACARSRCN